MTKSINNHLRYQNFVAYRTVFTFGQAGFGASWSNGSINNFGMSKCRNLIVNVRFATLADVSSIAFASTARICNFRAITVFMFIFVIKCVFINLKLIIFVTAFFTLAISYSVKIIVCFTNGYQFTKGVFTVSLIFILGFETKIVPSLAVII